MVVAIYGASPKPERISNKAIHRLVRKGHEVILVNPAYEEIEQLPVQPSLAEIKPGEIHTVTLYVNPTISNDLQEELIRVCPKRVIFNPGSENPELSKALTDAGIEVVEACTLVLLNTDQF